MTLCCLQISLLSGLATCRKALSHELLTYSFLVRVLLEFFLFSFSERFLSFYHSLGIKFALHMFEIYDLQKYPILPITPCLVLWLVPSIQHV